MPNQNGNISLGALDPLLEDPDVTEVMVNRWDAIFVERKGRLQEAPDVFKNPQELLDVLETLRGVLQTRGLPLDTKNPFADFRLSNKLRCHIVLPPIASDGPALTFRKFHQFHLTAEQLIGFGSWNAEIVQFLRACVVGRLNIVVAGGTNAGKTTVLNILTGMIPADERIITIENVLELQPPENLRHVVRLETRARDEDREGEVDIRDLIENALLMRPDRLITAEVRAEEALDMLQAMTTGHDGTMFGIHGTGIEDVLLRLETMLSSGYLSLPPLSVLRLIADAIDLIAYQERLADGTRRIVKIAEVLGVQGKNIQTQDLFEFRQTGIDAEGRVQGYHTATGHVPTFAERLRKSHMAARLQAEGVDLPLSLFTPTEG